MMFAVELEWRWCAIVVVDVVVSVVASLKFRASFACWPLLNRATCNRRTNERALAARSEIVDSSICVCFSYETYMSKNTAPKLKNIIYLSTNVLYETHRVNCKV